VPDFALLRNFIGKHYPPSERPCLLQQEALFLRSQELEGLRVLHCVPLVKNTLAKLLPLIASGADLYVTYPDFLAYDRAAKQVPEDAGVAVFEPHEILSSGAFARALSPICGRSLAQWSLPGRGSRSVKTLRFRASSAHRRGTRSATRG